MTDNFGLRSRNDQGSYIIDGNNPNFFLRSEGSLAHGIHTLSIRNRSHPVVALRGGVGAVLSITMTGDNVDVELFVKPFTNGGQVDYRIYGHTDAVSGFGLQVRGQDGNVIFNSEDHIFNVNHCVSWRAINNNPFTAPTGMTRQEDYRVSLGERVWKYITLDRYRGEWLVVSAIFGKRFYEYSVSEEAGGGYTKTFIYRYCAGINSSGNIEMRTDPALTEYIRVNGGSDTEDELTMFGDAIVTVR